MHGDSAKSGKAKNRIQLTVGCDVFGSLLVRKRARARIRGHTPASPQQVPRDGRGPVLSWPILQFEVQLWTVEGARAFRQYWPIIAAV